MHSAKCVRPHSLLSESSLTWKLSDWNNSLWKSMRTIHHAHQFWWRSCGEQCCYFSFVSNSDDVAFLKTVTTEKNLYSLFFIRLSCHPISAPSTTTTSNQAREATSIALVLGFVLCSASFYLACEQAGFKERGVPVVETKNNHVQLYLGTQIQSSLGNKILPLKHIKLLV